MTRANELELYMLELVNADRAAQGLKALKLETNLNEAAEDHSKWMLQSNQFSHTGSGDSTATQRIKAADFDLSGSWATAENIGIQTEGGEPGLRDDVAEIHASLMSSPGHRANLLDPNLEYLGIGIEEGSFTYPSGDTANSVIVTQNFAATEGSVDLDDGTGGSGPSTPVTPTPVEPTPTDPDPVEPTPTDPEPEPVEPKPTDPEPDPTDPKPTDPEPVEPKPTDPEPGPTDPKPVEPTPTDPDGDGPTPTPGSITDILSCLGSFDFLDDAELVISDGWLFGGFIFKFDDIETPDTPTDEVAMVEAASANGDDQQDLGSSDDVMRLEAFGNWEDVPMSSESDCMFA